MISNTASVRSIVGVMKKRFCSGVNRHLVAGTLLFYELSSVKERPLKKKKERKKSIRS